MTIKKPGKKSLKYIKVVECGDNEWSFEYPRVTFEVTERLYEIIELYHSGDFVNAEKKNSAIVKTFPEFIDAYHHLALLMDDTGRAYEAFNTVKIATDLGLSSLPANFYFGKDTLPWLILENRPFLRVYHYYGLKLFRLGETEKALCVFNNILDMNPNDNQGVRSLVINCYLTLKRPLDVLRIVESYKDDTSAEVLYGKVLALFQLERLKEAGKALDDAVKFLPRVATELAKKQHRKPKGMSMGLIACGGADEAYYYWKENGNHWKNTFGAIEFIREYLSKKR